MNGHDAMLELCALRALDVLAAADAARLDAHLAEGCEECEAALERQRAAVDLLPEGVDPVTPPEALRAQLVERARRDASGEPPRDDTRAPRAASPAWLRLALAASLVLAAGLGVLQVRQRAELAERSAAVEDLERALAVEQQLVREARSDLEEERRARSALEVETAALRQTLERLVAPDTRTVELAAQPDAPDARARAFLEPDSRSLVLYGYDLPELPPDKTYQAWVIRDAPVPAGVFRSEGALVRHEARDLPSLEGEIAVAVSIEPAGGRAAPSGPIILLGR